ncbi:hypothetical protein QIJ66_gp1 [ssRNA phage SRR7976299_8]|uniref:Uncharacterized protein n=1 Tax=ssRNA phage SRR7976299_8 TaxID=2786648 RepID=A0A8S5L0U5_9VIRU|nr:hypothetical protein QIJ66_gp1 [ssRNA phage SRR7976299_8]DAD51060.1 TPA_asm: hypothetical protein [ssRNA phage SRR7976299_8]
MATRAVLESLLGFLAAIASLRTSIKTFRWVLRRSRRNRQKAGQVGPEDSDLGDSDDGGLVERG